VPRFFFHIYDDEIALDEEGLELADRETARRVAVRGARALACEQVTRGELHLGHRIDVSGEGDTGLFSVRFGDAVAITD
jgi:hypothetical protein